jgi:hypothetical protein
MEPAVRPRPGDDSAGGVKIFRPIRFGTNGLRRVYLPSCKNGKQRFTSHHSYLSRLRFHTFIHVKVILLKLSIRLTYIREMVRITNLHPNMQGFHFGR